MKKTLYLMVGYPGSGKTTTSEYIAELTGATHLWADRVRRERYGEPAYTPAENKDLYDHLNELTAELLRANNSVVFDTNFGFRHDRDHLRDIAREHDADTKVIWVQAPQEIAKRRATDSPPDTRTRVLDVHMPVEKFDRLVSELEEPTPDETPLILDGTKITKEYVASILGL